MLTPRTNHLTGWRVSLFKEIHSNLHFTDSGKVVDDERLKFPAIDITQLTQVFYIELTVVPRLTI